MKITLPRSSTSKVTPRVSTAHPTPYSWVNRPPGSSSSSSGRLAGKNIAIKDNISCTLAPTSCSSSVLRDYYPPYNATCVDALISAGAHIAGQTKMDEFGMGSQTTHLPPHYTSVHNPSFPSDTAEEPPRSAGGSSGGSAAAVAEGSCWAALGTDTGGSIRLPASYCGVVGLKPSYGMISRRGVISYADSLDCVGVLGKSVDTVSEVFNTISHPDEQDMTCASSSARHVARDIFERHIEQDLPSYKEGSYTPLLSGLRIGIPSETALPSPYLRIPPLLLTHLKKIGASIHSVSLPSMKMALPAYYVLASAEASSNLARYGGSWYGSPYEIESDDLNEKEQGKEKESGAERRLRIRTQGFGKEVKKRILAGTYALSADEFNNTYLKALHLRNLLRKDYEKTFRIPHPLNSSSSTSSFTSTSEGVDVLLHPTAIQTAPTLSPKSQSEDKNEYLQDLLTVPASLSGLPALSIPSLPWQDGWPVGMSITSQWGMEPLIFWLGRAIQSWIKETS